MVHSLCVFSFAHSYMLLLNGCPDRWARASTSLLPPPIEHRHLNSSPLISHSLTSPTSPRPAAPARWLPIRYSNPRSRIARRVVVGQVQDLYIAVTVPATATLDVPIPLTGASQARVRRITRRFPMLHIVPHLALPGLECKFTRLRRLLRMLCQGTTVLTKIPMAMMRSMKLLWQSISENAIRWDVATTWPGMRSSTSWKTSSWEGLMWLMLVRSGIVSVCITLSDQL